MREALIPVETGYFSLKGAHKQWMTIQKTIDRIGRPIACHMLPTLHDPGSTVGCDVLVALHRNFAGQIVPTVIREHEVLREAASYGQPVVEYAADSEAARDFEQLADWLVEHAVRGPEIQIMPSTGPVATEHGGALAPPAQRESGGRAAELVSRAAEMAQRVRHLARRYEPGAAASPQSPDDAASKTSSGTMEHVFGVTQLGRSVLFVQPAGAARSIGVAGEFNDWSPGATPLRYNAETDTFEALVEVPPGIHRYRLVVDGQWTPDTYNPRHAPSASDAAQMDSLLVVKWDGEVER